MEAPPRYKLITLLTLLTMLTGFILLMLLTLLTLFTLLTLLTLFILLTLRYTALHCVTLLKHKHAFLYLLLGKVRTLL